MSRHPSFDEEKAKLTLFSQLVSHTSPPLPEPLYASFVQPNAYWTADDKDSFFVSLARHSRWQPYLIAEDIGKGRSVADVCAYIELLEQGSAGKVRHLREALPSAYEVSEEWVSVEESIAGILGREEGEWQRVAAKRKRAERLKEVKEALHTEHAGREDAPGDDEEEQEIWRERYKERKIELAALWKRENLLSSLDGRYLKTLESMVRALEDEEQDGELVHLDIPVEENLQRSHPSLFPAPVSPPPHASSGPALTTIPDRGNTKANTTSNSHIDPSLLALDTASHRTAPQLNPYSQPPVPGIQPQHSSSLRNASPGPSRVHDPPSTPANVPYTPSIGPTHGTPVLPPDLSPASRRRLRKRLWMRQKRAALNGLSASEISTDTRKLKPGRKGSSKAPEAQGKGKYVLTSDKFPDPQSGVPGGTDSVQALHGQTTEITHGPAIEDDGDATEGSEHAMKKKKQYGWAKLKAVDVDGAALRSEGLDLFHLGKLGSMTELLHDVHMPPTEEEREDNSEPVALSFSTLRLLRAYVAHFITLVLARVITQKEVETRQKKRVAGIFQTGGALEVRPDNIHEALAVLGEEISSKRFFKRLKNTVRAAGSAELSTGNSTQSLRGKGKRKKTVNPSDSETLSDDSEREVTDDTDSASEASTGISVNSHTDSESRDLPLAFTPQPSSGSFWNPELLFYTRDETLLPEETDEVALIQELRAEEKVEDVDQEADRTQEMALWEEIGVDRNEVVVAETGARTLGVSGVGEGKSRQSLRFRQPGGVVKSRVYIDSDEDEIENLL